MFDQEHQTEETPKPLADIIREETDDGRHIVRFLIDVMQGKVDDSKPCHRLDAARQLLNLGFHGAKAVIQSVPQSTNGRAPSRAPANSRFDQDLAGIIKLETSDGRDAVRFLVDVMQGNLDDFKPCHRLAAAKELLRRGFDNTPVDSDDDEDHDESFEDDNHQAPELSDPDSPTYVGRWGTLRNKKDAPFDFDNYDKEEFRRDNSGWRALKHIYGSVEAVQVAHEAASAYRSDAYFAGRMPDRDFSPIENTEDDPYGKGHYAYKLMRFAFENNGAVRAANFAVEDYNNRKHEHAGPPCDDPSCSYPISLREFASEAVRKSFEYEDRVKSQPDQPPENSDHDKPSGDQRQSSKDPDPPPSVILERSHVILSEAEGPPAPKPPPRQPTPNTYPGSPADDPPADGPRERRDPGDIRIPLRNLLSVSAGPL